MENLLAVPGHGGRYCDEMVDCSTTFDPLRTLVPCIASFGRSRIA
ncbi:hypothetical protein [Rhodopirellula baltica]